MFFLSSVFVYFLLLDFRALSIIIPELQFCDVIDTDAAFILANCNISVAEKMVYLPVYMCSFIRDETQLPILAPIQ